MVTSLIIFTRFAVQVKVHHGFDIAGSHLHHYCHAGVCVYLAQLLLECSLRKVLETYVDGCQYIIAVGYGGVLHRHPFVQLFLEMLEARTSFKKGVASQFKS